MAGCTQEANGVRDTSGKSSLLRTLQREKITSEFRPGGPGRGGGKRIRGKRKGRSKEERLRQGKGDRED